MKQFFDQALTFRLSTNPKGGLAYVNAYRFLNKIDLRPLFDYIRKEFEDSPTIKVRRTTFTLVNITSEFVGMSIGTEDTPQDTMILRSPLTMTFAMRRRDSIGGKARHVIWNTGHTCVWGTNLQRSHDFLTVSIPLNIIQMCGLNRMLRPNLERLYQVIGGFTKSLALGKKSVRNFDDVYKIRNAVFYKNMPVVMWYYDYDDLFFCRDTWDINPNIISTDINDLHLEYFVRFLTRYGNAISNSTSPSDDILMVIDDHLRSDVETMKYVDNYLYYVVCDLYPNVIKAYREDGTMSVIQVVDKLMGRTN